MKSDTKVIATAFISTFLIIVFGIFITSRQGQNSVPVIDPERLVRDDSYRIASDSARLTLVEFADFQCPACQYSYPVVKRIIDEYRGSLNYVYRHFPLSQHKHARILAYASESAGKQGKFWEMYDKIFSDKKDWGNIDDASEIIENYAREINLNLDMFYEYLEDEDIRKKVDKDYSDGINVGVQATPTFYLNGIKVDPKGFEDFKNLIEKALI